MSDLSSHVLAHYRHGALMERLQSILAGEASVLSRDELAPLDQFHTRGIAATAEIARATGIGADMEVLDIGAGLGGAARFVSAVCGCRVVGIDLNPSFVDAARYLSERTGQSAEVSFQVADARALPFEDGRFDVVLLQHVAMNIDDRARLYGEIRRVLKPAGKFATFDVIALSGEPHYPLPWARGPEMSFLLDAAATRQAIARAGFRELSWHDDTRAAKAWFEQVRTATPQPLNLGVVMGPDFRSFAANLGRDLAEGRLGVVTAIFEAAQARAQ